MNISIYDLQQDVNQHPILICKQESAYDATNLSDPDAIVNMLFNVFQPDRLFEEHLYLISLNSSCDVIAIFDAAHGTQTSAEIDPKSIFTRAMLSGASCIILAHNHPSGGLTPSEMDVAAYERIQELGEIMSLYLLDFLVLGKGGNYYSFKRKGTYNITN